MTEESGYTGVDILRALENAHRYNALLLSIILEHVGKAKSVVDFGAGTGTFAKLLRSQKFDVTCVEADPFLRSELAKTGFEALPDLAAVPDQSVSFVFSLNVFEHIADDGAVLKTLHRKLDANGRLLIYVPAFEVLWTSLDDKVEHYRRYTRQGLKRLLRSCGYEVERCRYVDSVGFVAALAFKVLGNKQGDLSPTAIRLYDKYVVPVSRLCDVLFQYFCGKNVYIVGVKEPVR